MTAQMHSVVLSQEIKCQCAFFPNLMAGFFLGIQLSYFGDLFKISIQNFVMQKTEIKIKF